MDPRFFFSFLVDRSEDGDVPDKNTAAANYQAPVSALCSAEQLNSELTAPLKNEFFGTNHVDLDRTQKRRGIFNQTVPFHSTVVVHAIQNLSFFPIKSITHACIHADNESTLPAIAELLYIHALLHRIPQPDDTTARRYHSQTETHRTDSWLTSVPQQEFGSFHGSSSTTST